MPPYRSARVRVGLVVEVFAVLAAPLVAWLVLHIRLMSPFDLPDPAIHTMFVVDPHGMLVRFAHLFGPTARLREAGRVGFLVPARIDYLLFGGVPGFVVTRYVFVLVAIGPTYLLLRRLSGVAAGWLGVSVVLTCPVLLLAWGTDYPDSAVVSYLLGGLACLALSWVGRRRVWLVAAVSLFTLAIWSHGLALPLVTVTAVVYLIVRLRRQRDAVWVDLLAALGTALAVTGLLSLGSGFLLGQFNFIGPTWQGYRFLNRPDQVAIWHSANWRWAPYVSYLLVPPAVVAAAGVVFARRVRALDSARLTIGLACAAQVALCWYLQFGNHVQALEMHYFSSTLWSAVVLTLTVTLIELAAPLLRRPAWAVLPAVAVVAVAALYELDRRVPAFGWWPWGAVAAMSLVAAAAVGVASSLGRPVVVTGAGAVLACVGIAAAALILTVAPSPSHRQLPGTSRNDPAPAYAGTLGGADNRIVDWYQLTTDVPGFVGPPSYPGEIVVTWWPRHERALVEPSCLYRPVQTLPTTLGVMAPSVSAALDADRPGEVLFLSQTGAGFGRALAELRGFGATLLRTAVFHAGSQSLHLWLVRLDAFGPRHG
jgi:hypothetical protein